MSRPRGYGDEREFRAGDRADEVGSFWGQRLRFEVMGPVRVVDHDGEPITVRGVVQRRILGALLARPDKPVRVDELVDMLWPDAPPANAVGNVRSYVAKLKRSSPAAPIPIEYGPGGYTLRVRAGELDSLVFVDEVRRAIQARRAGEHGTAGLLLDRALRLWQGEPFSDLADSLLLRPEIERLRQCRLEAFELGLDLGRGSELIPELGRIVEQHPYQERPVALLMRALHASGRQAEAQEAFRAARSRLVDDLGVDPHSELSELHEALLRGDDPPGPRGAALSLPAASRDGPVSEDRGAADPATPAATNPPVAGTSNPREPLVLVDRMPQPPRAFQPRPEQLRRLRAAAGTREPAVCTVTGPRGVGKTQLVAAHARERLARGDTVVWVTAANRESVVAGLADIADAVRPRAYEADAEQAARHARRWLSRLRAPGLLVFDDANEPDAIREWMPRAGRLQVVITSNRRVLGWLGDNVELDTFDRGEARAYLHAATGLPPDESTEAVIDAVGQYALGLGLAGAVITTEGLTYADYLRRLERLPTRDSLAAHEGDPYPHGVADAIRLSLAALEDADAPTRASAEHLALLAPTGVSRDLLVPGTLDEHGRAHRSRAVGALVDAYLAHYAEDGRLVVMHPLTRRVVAELCAEQGRIEEMLRTATAMVSDHARRARGSDGERRAMREALEHLESLVGVAERGHVGGGAVSELLAVCTSVIGYFHHRCEFVRAAPLNAAVHRQQERLLGADDPETLRSCTELAREYRRQADLDRAVALLRDTLERQERRIAPDHEDTWRTRHTLAATHLVAGRAETAIAMLREMATADERHVDETDVRLGSSRRLAWALRSLGRIEEAVRIYRAILPAYDRVLGPEHPQTLRTASEYACVHRFAGRLDEAEQELTRVLATRERALGRDHPDNWHDRDRLADVWRAMGASRAEDARAAFERTAAHWETALGARHPWTLLATNNLACAIEAAGDREAALAKLRAAHHAHEDVLGPALPRTLNVANNLGCVLARLGDHSAAAETLRDALAGRRRVMGEAHPDTEATRHNLAVVRARIGRYGDDLRWTDADEIGDSDVPSGTLPSWIRNGNAYGAGHSVDSTIRLSSEEPG